ncbi:3'(2'),5'-bisphosphate nucleotidase [Aphanothece sacrum]|uniref:3'(2'),5'-bisphosphate nucleotidase n=1 Tax=Aphanothece sacrum FPU1 TaxID=1920663 RepID=A0A401IGJ6_APHSA|nr:3'(2'),5'-bisphosphate nucleotidase [Aphanothece sacrum]GBF80403.1 3'(2'),5'-bisphosphate nucleotidase [Aphanothece sacrum FPU1]GBF84890.1 3'(2'),5'-bisphosphate nucleotidase [Aphanothece sacrum FPU3]
MLKNQEIEVAIAAVTTAAKLCQQVQETKAAQTLAKADTSPVTVADFGAQAIICQALAQEFPNDPVIGEEDASILQKPELSPILGLITHQVQQIRPDATESDIIDWINWGNGQIAPRYWTLDPIDGTKGFIRGDQYAIALALIEQGKVRLGILACPVFPREGNSKGVIFFAMEGQGAWEMPLEGGKLQQIRINSWDDVQQLCRIESVESGHSDRTQQVKLDRKLGLVRPAKQMDSLAKYGALARGDADIYTRVPVPQFITKKENIWDHGPGVIIVEEAGGKVTDLDGKFLDFSVGSKLSNNRGILATNGVIHQKILDIIAEINDI